MTAAPGDCSGFWGSAQEEMREAKDEPEVLCDQPRAMGLIHYDYWTHVAA